MKNFLSFCTIFLAVLSGFVVLKITNNYFLWIAAVCVSCFIFGIISKKIMCLMDKNGKDKTGDDKNTGDGSVC